MIPLMHSQQAELNKPRAHHFWRRQSLIPLILLTLLALPALQPLAGRGLTCGFDTAFHLWRAVEAGGLLRQGLLFARWAPHMAHGYGYPLFLFQSPLSAYLAALLNLLGIEWPLAINAVYALGLLFSALTLWLLARDLWGKRGGIVAAVAFLYAPFHAYVAFYRASLSETVAWSLPPLILWGLRRWQQRQERWGFAAAVLGTAALMLIHDVSVYTFLPLFLGWIGAIALLERSWSAAGRGALAFGLGLGSSAFFWLPALLERNAIQFERANSAWPFQYSHNFLPLGQLLALPRNADPALLNDWPPRALGLLLLAAALLGCLAGLRQSRERQWLTALLAAALAGYIFLALPVSRPLWDAVPPLSAFQFPWRFLAPATLAAALLAGALFARLPAGNRSLAMAGWLVVVAVLNVGHWGWFYPDTCAPPDDISTAGMVAWERGSDTLGTTARRELLPATVQRMPQDENQPPPWQARLAPAELPPGAQLLATDYRPLDATIELETPQPFQARYRAFAFPGWRVTIDGQAVPITPSTPEGLITFEVPAGRHTIVVRFGETPLRLAADALALVSLLLAVMVARGQGRPATGDRRPATANCQLLTGNCRLPAAVFLLALALVAGKVLLVDQELTPLRQTRLGADGKLAGITQPLTLDFGGANPDSVQVQLLGHQALPETVPADEALEVILYWRPLAPITGDYRVGLNLVDGDGRRWSAAGLRDSRWFNRPPPTAAWPLDQYALTALLVDPLPGTPPGDYTLQLSLFERDTLAPLTIYDEAALSLGPSVSLGSVRLVEPRRPWPAEEVAMQYRLNVVTPELTLWGVNVDRAEAAPGDPALVTLFWSSGRREASEATLNLVDERGQVATSWPVTMPAWGEGLWRSQSLLRLPAALEDGRYTWELELAGGQAITWASLAINAPERLLAPPVVAIPAGVTLAEQATLVGVTVARQNGEIVEPGRAAQRGETLTVNLVWRGRQEMADSYHVFVHLTGPAGNLVAQSDAIPAGWQRPTTGWRPGEYVVDAHVLTIPVDVPVGEYTLEAGLYLPGRGRLATTNGSDSVRLITLILK